MRSTGSMISDMVSLKESRELVRNLQARNADLLAALKTAVLVWETQEAAKPLGKCSLSNPPIWIIDARAAIAKAG